MKPVYDEAYRDDTYPIPAMIVGSKKVSMTLHWKVFDDLCVPVRTIFHGLKAEIATNLED